ncbi:MAG: hypothetical protein IJW70_09635 [Clostridia bacterium]|nr:hypothetical protein [Clostridia bacterium]
MKKNTKKAIACTGTLLCVITLLLVVVPILRYRAYYSDVPVFIGNPFMQKLIYHDTDVVMLPGELDKVIYHGNVYVGDYDTDWHFDDEKMQYAGKIHYRKILHFYCNYNVYVSENAVTEQGTPIYLSLEGVPPFYYVLEGYEAPDIMITELCWDVCGQSLPDTAKLEETVDMHAAISYNADMKKVCTATMSSVEFAFMHDYADVYAYDGRYYLRMGTDTLYPIINEELTGCIEQARAQE